VPFCIPSFRFSFCIRHEGSLRLFTSLFTLYTHSHATSTVTPKRFPLRSVARRNVRQPDASLPRSFLLHLPPPRFTSLSSFYIVTCKPPFQVPEIACLERSVGREKISRQSKRRGDRKSCRTLLIPHTLESSHQRCLHQLLLRRSKSARRTSSAQRSVPVRVEVTPARVPTEFRDDKEGTGGHSAYEPRRSIGTDRSPSAPSASASTRPLGSLPTPDRQLAHHRACAPSPCLNSCDADRSTVPTTGVTT
jgi:hypothetical protein